MTISQLRSHVFLLLAPALLLAPLCLGETLTVGPKGQFPLPCAALNAANDGDTVEIDAAGTYVGDVCAFTANNLLIRGVNGRPHIQAGGGNAWGKGTWVPTGRNTTVENLEMSGATVPDGNGAAIRLDGIDLTLRYVYFHDNEDGVLTNGRGGTILVEYSEFDNNGDGVGYAHNLYVTEERSLTVRFSYFHRAKVGHVIKSRASQNYFYYNRFASEDVNSSLEIDLPNGGYGVIVGNVIQQGPLSENQSLVGYMEEGTLQGYDNTLIFAYNTVINDGPGADDNGPVNLFLFPPKGSFTATFVNNIFFGPGALPDPAVYPGVGFLSNYVTADKVFLNESGGDYRLADGSPAIGATGDVPATLVPIVTPLFQQQEVMCGQRRPAVIPPSPGAYEAGPSEVNLSNPCTVDWPGLAPHVNLANTSLAAPGTAVAQVALDGVAPVGGAEVVLTYSHPQYVKGPAQVTIAAGTASTTAQIQFLAPDTTTVFTITATYLDRSSDTYVAYTLPTVRVPVLERLTLASGALTGGMTTSRNLVELAARTPAPETVLLASSRPDLVAVPSSVTVAPGADTGIFAIQTQPVTTPTLVLLTATLRGVQVTADLIVNPVTLASLQAPGRTLGGPAVHQLTVSLTGPAPAAGLTVQLASSAPEAVSVPLQVLVEGGKSSAAVTATVSDVSAPVTAQITATEQQQTRAVLVTAEAFAISGLTLQPATMTGGLTSGSHRVTLNSPAPAGQPITVRLTSSSPGQAQAPATVVISPGFASASFQIVTAWVTGLTKVQITASVEPAANTVVFHGTAQRTATLTLTP